MQKSCTFHRLALLIPAAALLLAGCSKEEMAESIPQLSFSFEYPALPVTVDSAQMAQEGGLVLDLGAQALNEALATHGYVPTQVQELSFNKARLYFAAPMNSFYNALASVKVQIVIGDSTQPQTIALLNPVPEGAQTLLLDLSGLDLPQLVHANNAKLFLSMQFDGPIPQQTQHVLALGAKVTVGL